MNHTYEIEDIHEIMTMSIPDFAGKYGVSYADAHKWLRGAHNTLRLARWEPFATVMRELDIDIKPGLFNQDVLNTLQEGSCVSHQAAIFTLAVHEQMGGIDYYYHDKKDHKYTNKLWDFRENNHD